MHDQNGLTLIDIAVVLVIIGLLLGGVLKGRDLIQGAGSTATTSMLNPAANLLPVTFGGAFGKTASASPSSVMLEAPRQPERS
jgi:hypothetical protein